MPGKQKRMTEVHAAMRASAERVFAELADGWAYVGWVVGAAHIRDVDASWPEVGSKIYHKVGVWPFEVSDYTESLECEPDRRLLLRARGWPLGEASVRIEMVDVADGCDITIREKPVAGPARLLPTPVADPLLEVRNRECLRRLAYLAEGHAR